MTEFAIGLINACKYYVFTNYIRSIMFVYLCIMFACEYYVFIYV